MRTNRSLLDVAWPEKFSVIPKEVFHREDVYQEELKRIFYGPEWHPVAHLAEISEPGDFKLAFVGEASVLVVRGNDGEPRVFKNSCPHRGTQLATSNRGNIAKGIQCPYHRWSFDCQGKLLAAPGKERFPIDWKAEDYGLAALRHDVVQGLVFVTFDPGAPALTEFLDGQVAEYLEKALGPADELRLLGYQRVLFSANWKEYSDNEGYHAPLLHRAFQLLKWQGGGGTQCVTAFGHKLIEAELREAKKSAFLADPSLVEHRDRSVSLNSVIIALFPVTVITKHLDVINVRFAFPRSPDEIEVHYAYFGRTTDDPELQSHRLRQASNLLGPSGFISLEDGAVFNRLHRGARTTGNVEFQKGVDAQMDPPCFVEQNDEGSNLVKWERYRRIMEFTRG